MISKDEIKKLADLARIGVEDEEAEDLAGEIDAILGYVKLIQQFHPDEALSKISAEEGSSVINILREDTNPNESGAYTEAILKEMPNTEKGFLKVKKIL